jgi:outer membrane protein assembly factor BamB
MMTLRLHCLLLTACLATTCCAAQEWTRFRGPNGAGQSEATTIPATWTRQDELWRTELPGIGNSSPVLWGDRIFLQSADPADGTRYIVCASASDGHVEWKQSYESKTHKIHVQNTLASSTPTVDAERVYCAWATPEELTMAALTHDGRLTWKINLGPFVSLHGFAASPICFEDLVILTNDQDADSFLVAVEAATGNVRWKVPRLIREEQSASYATPCVLAGPRGQLELLVCGWAHGITSLDPRTGKSNWEVPVLERRPVGSPILVEGMILANCGEGSGNNSVVAMRPSGAIDQPPELVYKLDKTSAPYVPTMVAKGSLVFLWGDRGVVTCIDARDGKVHWRQRVGGNYYGSPVRVADVVYCASSEGDIVSLAASDQFKLLGRSPLGEPSRATPAVVGGRMFVRSNSHLIAVGQ